MMVLDASMALSWLIDGDILPARAAVQDLVLEQGAVVPLHWHLEVANSLLMAVKRRRISPSYRDEAITDLRRLKIILDDQTAARAWTDTLGLADRFGLTLYDAAYLELAGRRKLPLATLDEELRQAAADAGVPLLGS